MATFKNRALTLATRGILSGVALTIATRGALQLPEQPTGPVVTPPPAVSAAPRRAFGQVSFEYSEQHRFRSEVLWHLGLDVDSRYEGQDAAEYHASSRLAWLLDIGTTDEGIAQYGYSPVLEWTLAIGASSRAEPAEGPQVAHFRSRVAIGGAVRGAEALRALHTATIPAGIAPDVRSRSLPVAPDAKVNLHALSVGHLQISTRSTYSPESVAEYAAAATMPAGLQVTTRTTHVTADSARHTHKTSTAYGAELRYVVHYERAPVQPLDDDEEILLLLAQLLTRRDDA